MKVTLRQRLKSGSIILYLDYYQSGKREYEYLGLSLISKPTTKEQREENKNTLSLAEQIRSKRHLEIQAGIYGFRKQDKQTTSFTEFFKALAEQKKGTWNNALAMLTKYSPFIEFNHIDTKRVQDFKAYLQRATTKGNVLLSASTQSSYFSKVKQALQQAYAQGLIKVNPAERVAGIKPNESQREFLTALELNTLAQEDCDNDLLKRAFLFSALTGLRWSDIIKLKWDELHYSAEMGHYLRFFQKKTHNAQTLPISDQAVDLLGNNNGGSIFGALEYNSWTNTLLQRWVTNAGISKQVTFHGARHTYAVLQIAGGTDIYTVSAMLGHHSVKSTQLYAKVIDSKKMQATDKIQIQF